MSYLFNVQFASFFETIKILHLKTPFFFSPRTVVDFYFVMMMFILSYNSIDDNDAEKHGMPRQFFFFLSLFTILPSSTIFNSAH